MATLAAVELSHHNPVHYANQYMIFEGQFECPKFVAGLHSTNESHPIASIVRSDSRFNARGDGFVKAIINRCKIHTLRTAVIPLDSEFAGFALSKFNLYLGIQLFQRNRRWNRCSQIGCMSSASSEVHSRTRQTAWHDAAILGATSMSFVILIGQSERPPMRIQAIPNFAFSVIVDCSGSNRFRGTADGTDARRLVVMSSAYICVICGSLRNPANSLA